MVRLSFINPFNYQLTDVFVSSLKLKDTPSCGVRTNNGKTEILCVAIYPDEDTLTIEYMHTLNNRTTYFSFNVDTIDLTADLVNDSLARTAEDYNSCIKSLDLYIKTSKR